VARHSELRITDFLDDIANVPTIEGLDHKFAQASAQFKSDAESMAKLTLAKTERKKALESPKAELTPPQPGSSKKLFQKPGEPAAA
jgi:hypothetical protein